MRAATETREPRTDPRRAPYGKPLLPAPLAPSTSQGPPPAARTRPAPAPAPTRPSRLGSPEPSLHPPCPAPGPLGTALRTAGLEATAASSLAAARTHERRGPGSRGISPGQQEALPRGSRGRPVTPPALPPDRKARLLPPPPPPRRKDTWQCLHLQAAQAALRERPPYASPRATTFPHVPPRPPPETMARSPASRPAALHLGQVPPPPRIHTPLGSGRHGCPLSQKCRPRPAR